MADRMNRPLILVVDDDRKTAASIKLYMEHAGFEVATGYDGRQALAVFHDRRPGLVILDWMLPELSGLEVCRAIRQVSGVPIIMLTARAREDDKLTGLDTGADDYVSKPFSPRELVARARAVLRRSQMTEEPRAEIRVDALAIDLRSREIRVEGKQISLTPTEFRLLEVMARAPGRTFTRSELVERTFGWDYDGLERTVDAHIMKLRRKLGAADNRPAYISTVFGIGYKFSGERDDS